MKVRILILELLQNSKEDKVGLTSVVSCSNVEVSDYLVRSSSEVAKGYRLIYVDFHMPEDRDVNSLSISVILLVIIASQNKLKITR